MEAENSFLKELWTVNPHERLVWTGDTEHEIMRIKSKWMEQELEQELYYNSSEYSVSGIVEKISRAKANLYNTDEDHPCQLCTLKELKEKGMDQEEIESCDVEIPKGAFVFEF